MDIVVVNPNTGERKTLQQVSPAGLKSWLGSGWTLEGGQGYGYDQQAQQFLPGAGNPTINQAMQSLQSAQSQPGQVSPDYSALRLLQQQLGQQQGPGGQPPAWLAGLLQGQRSPMVTTASDVEGPEQTVNRNIPVRIALINPDTGVVDTGLADGSDPRQFANWEEARLHIINSGETVQRVNSADEAKSIVAQYTGNPDYAGYGDNYQAPTPQPGSPAALGQQYDPSWANVPPGSPPGTPTGPLTPGGPLPPPVPGSPQPPPGPAGPEAPPYGPGPDYQPGGAYTPGAPPSSAPLPDNLEDALRQLMQDARTQGKAGQENYAGLIDDLKNSLAFNRAGAEQSYNQGNQFAQQFAGMVTPGIQSAIGTMNQATGLSPEAMTALRRQAVEGTERDYQSNISSLKSQLGQRGAFGGQTPGDVNALLSGYAPLMGARDASRSSQLANATLADEQRKFDTLGLNRQTAAQFGGISAGLSTGLKNAFSPSPFLSGADSALSGLGSAINAGNQSGFQGIQTAGNLAGTWADQQPESFKNILYSSLLNTGLNTGGNLLGDWLGGLGGNQGTQQGGNPDQGGGFWSTLGGALKKIFL